MRKTVTPSFNQPTQASILRLVFTYDASTSIRDMWTGTTQAQVQARVPFCVVISSMRIFPGKTLCISKNTLTQLRRTQKPKVKRTGPSVRTAPVATEEIRSTRGTSNTLQVISAGRFKTNGLASLAAHAQAQSKARNSRRFAFVSGLLDPLAPLPCSDHCVITHHISLERLAIRQRITTIIASVASSVYLSLFLSTSSPPPTHTLTCHILSRLPLPSTCWDCVVAVAVIIFPRLVMLLSFSTV